MHILVLTQFYPPEPLVLMHEMAATLLAMGHRVTVLTGFPNYPSGKLYPGYSLRLWQREARAGVSVIRVALYPDHSRSTLRRSANYLSFALSSTLLGGLLAQRPDVIFAHHAPLTVGFPAQVLSRLWRVPYVYQIQDLWPEAVLATGMLRSKALLGWVDRFARRVYERASAICVISPGFRSNLIAKGVPSQKIHVISNWVDTSVYKPAQRDAAKADNLGLDNGFNVMFAGNMGEAQGLETVLDAADLLKDEPKIRFVMVGDGVSLPILRKQAQGRGLPNVRFLGRHSQAEMPALLALADVLLIHLRDHPLLRSNIPHKTFAYLASGRPILAAAAGDAADVVHNAGAGIVCQPDKPKALASAVRELSRMPPQEREKMARRGRLAARNQYDRQVLVGQIESLLRQVVEDAVQYPAACAGGQLVESRSRTGTS